MVNAKSKILILITGLATCVGLVSPVAAAGPNNKAGSIEVGGLAGYQFFSDDN